MSLCSLSPLWLIIRVKKHQFRKSSSISSHKNLQQEKKQPSHPKNTSIKEHQQSYLSKKHVKQARIGTDSVVSVMNNLTQNLRQSAFLSFETGNQGKKIHFNVMYCVNYTEFYRKVTEKVVTSAQIYSTNIQTKQRDYLGMQSKNSHRQFNVWKVEQIYKSKIDQVYKSQQID